MKVERLISKNSNMAKIMSMTANAEKDFIEKMEQHQEEQHKKIQQHFEERWQEFVTEYASDVEKINKETNTFFKDIFMFGCNTGWNDCYMFHEDLIQKGLNQQQINGKSKSSTTTID